MTQTRDIFPIRMQLTAMKMPEGRHQAIAASHDQRSPIHLTAPTEATAPQDCTLVIYPGEPSELLVRLENLTADPLRVDLDVTGNFPAQWCQVGGEGNEIPPAGRMEVVLYFQVDADFFESPLGRLPKTPLQLDYAGQFVATYTTAAGGQPTQQSADFQVLVRPRSLYLDFLPDVYREVDFVGRFLKIFEQAFEPDVQILNSLWAYLHPRTAPDALIPFLAYWVGWPLTPQLSLATQRRLIAGALQLYRWRGTRRGLRYAIHLFTGLPLEVEEGEPQIQITELGGRGFVMGETRLGREATMGGGQPYHFVVELRAPPSAPLDLDLVRKVIEQEKPAFCSYELYVSEDTENRGSI